MSHANSPHSEKIRPALDATVTKLNHFVRQFKFGDKTDKTPSPDKTRAIHFVSNVAFLRPRDKRSAPRAGDASTALVNGEQLSQQLINVSACANEIVLQVQSITSFRFSWRARYY